jgi:hypothetical protein
MTPGPVRMDDIWKPFIQKLHPNMRLGQSVKLLDNLSTLTFTTQDHANVKGILYS